MERTTEHAATCRRIEEVVRWPRLVGAELEIWGAAADVTALWGADVCSNVYCGAHGSHSVTVNAKEGRHGSAPSGFVGPMLTQADSQRYCRTFVRVWQGSVALGLARPGPLWGRVGMKGGGQSKRDVLGRIFTSLCGHPVGTLGESYDDGLFQR